MARKPQDLPGPTGFSLTPQVPTIWGTRAPIGPYIVGTWGVRVRCHFWVKGSGVEGFRSLGV